MYLNLKTKNLATDDFITIKTIYKLKAKSFY